MKKVIEKHPVLFIMIGFFIVILIGLFISFLSAEKPKTTESTATEKAEMSEEQTEEPTEKPTENQTEATAQQMVVNEDNYINILNAIILEDFDGLPVTDALIADYSNGYFSGQDVVAIEPILDMCNFNEHTACFNITTTDGVVDSYGVSFTVVDGLLNYINIYYVPSGAEGGV